jgi:fused signal recognition particle receptor
MISPGTSDGAKGGWLARLKRGLAQDARQHRRPVLGRRGRRRLPRGTRDGADRRRCRRRVVGELLDAVRSAIKLKGLKTQDEVRIALRDELARGARTRRRPLRSVARAAVVVMVCGVNGAGKTTSIGKLAKWFAGQQRSVLLAAGDTFRAAAREQLAVWGRATASTSSPRAAAIRPPWSSTPSPPPGARRRRADRRHRRAGCRRRRT